jgi:hypothetical protein
MHPLKNSDCCILGVLRFLLLYERESYCCNITISGSGVVEHT